MNEAPRIDAVLLYYEGAPERLVQAETQTADYMVSDVAAAALDLERRRPAMVAAPDLAALLKELAARGLMSQHLPDAATRLK